MNATKSQLNITYSWSSTELQLLVSAGAPSREGAKGLINCLRFVCGPCVNTEHHYLAVRTLYHSHYRKWHLFRFQCMLDRAHAHARASKQRTYQAPAILTIEDVQPSAECKIPDADGAAACIASATLLAEALPNPADALCLTYPQCCLSGPLWQPSLSCNSHAWQCSIHVTQSSSW